MIYDFIVVGSGSGGGSLSYYLNKSGAKLKLVNSTEKILFQKLKQKHPLIYIGVVVLNLIRLEELDFYAPKWWAVHLSYINV